MLEIEAMNPEGLCNLLQVLGGGHRMKRSVQGETTTDVLKRARTERTQMEMCPVNNTTTSLLGA